MFNYRKQEIQDEFALVNISVDAHTQVNSSDEGLSGGGGLDAGHTGPSL